MLPRRPIVGRADRCLAEVLNAIGAGPASDSAHSGKAQGEPAELRLDIVSRSNRDFVAARLRERHTARRRNAAASCTRRQREARSARSRGRRHLRMLANESVAMCAGRLTRIPLAESARLMPVNASPPRTAVRAHAGHFSCKPAASRPGGRRPIANSSRSPRSSLDNSAAIVPLCCNRQRCFGDRGDCAKRVVTTRWQPVVTTRPKPQPARLSGVLAQVTTPSDGLPAVVKTDRATRPAPPAPRGPRATPRPSAHPRALGERLDSMDRVRTATAIEGQCRVPWRPAAKQRHEAGVVSRVPRGSRIAEAVGTDRYTDRTCITHQQHREHVASNANSKRRYQTETT